MTIDEVQYAPQLFSAIRLAADRDGRNGLLWLTGSQKFQFMQGLTESQAGRVAIVDLLSFSLAEQHNRALACEPFVPTHALDQPGPHCGQTGAIQGPV